MIREALEFIADLKAASISPRPIDTGSSENLVFLVPSSDGDLDEHRIARAIPPRRHEVGDLATIVKLANRFADKDEDNSSPVVWINENMISLVIDDNEHRVNTATLVLEYADVFRCLQKLVGYPGVWTEQKAFIRLLRVDLAGTLPPGILLDRVRKLKFEAGQVTTQIATKDRESLGRQIHAAVSGEGEIPEEVTIEAPVFRGFDRRSIICSVDIDPARGLLQIVPLPDELDRVTRLTLANIQKTIGAMVPESVPVYLGKP